MIHGYSKFAFLINLWDSLGRIKWLPVNLIRVQFRLILRAFKNHLQIFSTTSLPMHQLRLMALVSEVPDRLISFPVSCRPASKRIVRTEGVSFGSSTDGYSKFLSRRQRRDAWLVVDGATANKTSSLWRTSAWLWIEGPAFETVTLLNLAKKQLARRSVITQFDKKFLDLLIEDPRYHDK